jgi:hypothetical protein
VAAGVLWVTRRQQWWGLALVLLLGAFLWALIWVTGAYFKPADSLPLGLFILALGATFVASMHKAYASEAQESDNSQAYLKILIALAGVGATGLMGLVALYANFGLLEWGLFGLLALASVALAFFNQKLYGLAPLVSMVASLLMLFAWGVLNKKHAMPDNFVLVLSAFALLYTASGYLLQKRSARPLLWALLIAAAGLGYYLLAYYVLNTHAHLRALMAGGSGVFGLPPLLWGGIALAAAGVSASYAGRGDARAA